jgi:phosphopantetheinyl transferase
LGGPLAATTAAGVTLWQVPMRPDELCTQSGGICLRIIAQVILAPTERAEWKALAGSLRYRREWLFGRAALKESVRHWVHAQTGEWLYMTDIEVGHDALGAPFVDGDWRGRLIDAPQVSLSHNAELCLAAVAAPGQAVGVDLEDLARVRRLELVAESFAPEERSWLEGLDGAARTERVIRLWCAKEAAAKCLGTGLQGQPEAFVVVSVDAKCEKLLVESAWGAVKTWIRHHKGTIIAVATQEATDLEVMDE